MPVTTFLVNFLKKLAIWNLKKNNNNFNRIVFLLHSLTKKRNEFYELGLAIEGRQKFKKKILD